MIKTSYNFQVRPIKKVLVANRSGFFCNLDDVKDHDKDSNDGGFMVVSLGGAEPISEGSDSPPAASVGAASPGAASSEASPGAAF